MTYNDEVPERVVRKIRARAAVSPDGCWVWLGSKSSGYGRIAWSDGRRMVYSATHRAMWVASRGPIPDGLDLDHLCRNRACCNPDHLEPVTRRVNLLRGVTTPAARAKVTHCPRGHEYTPDNTLTSKRGQRSCKECTYAKNRAYYHRNAERRAAYNREWRARRKGA